MARKSKKAPAPEIRGLEETARFFNTTAPTIRAWLREGCPVEEKGGNGKPYKFDLRAVAAWRQERGAEEQRAAEARAETDAQLRLELLGGDMLPEAGGASGPLTPAQRRDILRAEVDKVKLAQARRELVPAAEVRDALVGPLALVRERLRALPDDLGRRFGLSDDQVTEVLEHIDDMLNDLVDEVAALVQDPADDAQAA